MKRNDLYRVKVNDAYQYEDDKIYSKTFRVISEEENDGFDILIRFTQLDIDRRKTITFFMDTVKTSMEKVNAKTDKYR